MFATYDGKTYLYDRIDGRSFISTYRKEKADESFSFDDGVWTKEISPQDNRLTELYKKQFWAEYTDAAEGRKAWIVNEGRPGHAKPDLDKGELLIAIPKVRKRKGWNPYGEKASSKIVRVEECSYYFVEKMFSNPETGEVKRAETKWKTMSEFVDEMKRTRPENV